MLSIEHGSGVMRLPARVSAGTRALARIGAALALAAVGVLAAAGCSVMPPKFAKPTLSVAGVELQSGNILQQNFLVKFSIQNPNDRALPVTGLHAELNVLGERVASGVSNRPFVVPAFGTAEFDMTISANLAAALIKLGTRANANADAIDYEMTGAAQVDLPFLHAVPFRQGGTFSLAGPP